MAAVQVAAREAGIKGAAFNVLAYLCSVADFRKPIARASKLRMEQRTGYCDKTIKAALATLRAAGFIEAVAFATGGRGLCPVYVIRTTKGGENFPPLEEQDLVKGGKKLPEKGGKNFQKRGEKTSPPSGYSSIGSSLGEKGAAFSGGRDQRGLDACASASPPSGPVPSREELQALSRETAAFGYTEAARLMHQRRAERQSGGISP